MTTTPKDSSQHAELAAEPCKPATAIQIEFGGGTIELKSATVQCAGEGEEVEDLVPWGQKAKLFGVGETEGNEQTGFAPIRLYRTEYARENGIQRVVLLEGHRYRWVLKTSNPAHKVTTSFDPVSGDEKGKKGASFRFVLSDQPEKTTDGAIGSFSVSNYFGSAFLKIEGVGTLWFEIVPRKMDYLAHYRAMMADLSNRMEAMLLDWSAPTEQPLASDAEKEGVLIQQFNTLVNGIGVQKLRDWLNAVKRNPHRAMVAESRWEPISVGRQERFAKTPAVYGRDWMVLKSGGGACGIATSIGQALPQELSSVRKYDTVDTPPNRFVKFALGQFSAICRKVLEIFEGKKKEGKEEKLYPAEIEARNLLEALESIRRDSFFDEVGDLRSLPLNNQTLQKRHGYRQILKAWTRVRRATKFKWEAFEDEFYRGDTRDVPTLYEYWIFFHLREIIEKIEKPDNAPEWANGIEALDDCGEDPSFLQRTGEGGAVNLKEGETVLCRYRWDSGLGNPLRLHLYYNRSFPASHSGPDSEESVKKVFEPGSYSRIFDPDYTLVVFPERYAKGEGTADAHEAAAGEEGHLAFLHFDAKYRVENFDVFTGGFLSEEESPEAAGQSKEVKKAESATGQYKTGDLIKMHCYNDAIRRTRGSYILFPGPAPQSGDKNPESVKFSHYHEVLPGIGAFRLLPKFEENKPSSDGGDVLREFLRDVLENQEDQFSQRAQIENLTTNIIMEAPPKMDRGRFVYDELSGECDIQTPALVGYIPSAVQAICKSKGVFYFYARKGHTGYALPGGLREGMPFLPYSDKGWLGWKAIVKSIGVISGESLEKMLGVSGYKPSAESYFLVSYEEQNDLEKGQIEILKNHRTEPHRPKVVSWLELFPHAFYA